MEGQAAAYDLLLSFHRAVCAHLYFINIFAADFLLPDLAECITGLFAAFDAFHKLYFFPALLRVNVISRRSAYFAPCHFYL